MFLISLYLISKYNKKNQQWYIFATKNILNRINLKYHETYMAFIYGDL